MRFAISRYNIMIIIALMLLISGCTGTKIIVKPDPSSIKPSTEKNCGVVAVKEAGENFVYSGDVQLFAKELEKSGLYDKVYYPARHDDKVDLILDTKFIGKLTHDKVVGFTQSIIIGLSLFILEPVFWYDYYLDFNGKVAIVVNDNVVDTIESNTHTQMSVKWLSLMSIDNVAVQALKASSESMFKQIINELNVYCRKHPGPAK